jgi:hypothetical protein
LRSGLLRRRNGLSGLNLFQSVAAELKVGAVVISSSLCTAVKQAEIPSKW